MWNFNISLKSIKNFFVINSVLLSIGFLEFHFITITQKNNYLLDLFSIFFVLTTRNYFLLYFIESDIQKKENISNDIVDIPKEEYIYEFHYHLLTTTFIESLTHLFIKIYMIQYIVKNIYYELLTFIPISFCFEIIFDFFHYCAHRLLHSNAFLYKNIHKKHHKFKHPISIITFYQEPLDLLFTNSIPTILSVLFLYNISYLQFHYILVYKMFIEISGHLGKKMYPASSFSQFIWLPRILNIELYTEDHDLHHSLNNCNYSKRFSVFDKLFGTYKSFSGNNIFS
jgi:sterol desaturase/sphingolipid hydroxylase (fatty acid hydroxylase superfamily)